MAAKARAGLGRRLQRWTIHRLRRSRFLPVGIPDKIADEDRLDQPFTAPIMVFFATVQDSLYQIRPWYEALTALAGAHSLVLVFKDSRTAAIVRTQTGLDCVTLAKYGQLDAILSMSDVKLALYINHDPLNFESLRFTSMVHVYLGHGDSDKGVSVSNQIKAYDYCFVAGQAAIDRIAGQVMGYDATSRCLPIGQPTAVRAPAASRAAPDTSQRPTILYAPTWEGAQPSVSYGSLETHGLKLATAIATSGDYRFIYRPHPLSGVISPSYGRADAAIRELVAAAAGNRVDTDNAIEDSFTDADLLICDVSAVSLNWLPSGKPLIVTRPAAPTGDSKLMRSVPLLDADADMVSMVASALDADHDAANRASLVEYYLGDTAPGAATANFIAACSTMMANRDEDWSALRRKGAVGP